MTDKNSLGVKFLYNSHLLIQNLSFQMESYILGSLYLLKFKYFEPLPKDFILIQRGERQTSGFMKVSLRK